MSRRIVMIVGIVVSLAWAVGFYEYASQVEALQAKSLGEFVYDRCLSQNHDVSRCFAARDDAEAVSRSGFPMINVWLIIAIPISLGWLIGWFVSRLKGRKRASASA